MERLMDELRFPIIKDIYYGGVTVGKLDGLSPLDIYVTWRLTDKGYSVVDFHNLTDTSLKYDSVPFIDRMGCIYSYEQLTGDFTDFVLGSKNIVSVGEAFKKSMEERESQRAAYELEYQNEKKELEIALSKLTSRELDLIRSYRD